MCEMFLAKSDRHVRSDNYCRVNCWVALSPLFVVCNFSFLSSYGARECMYVENLGTVEFVDIWWKHAHLRATSWPIRAICVNQSELNL